MTQTLADVYLDNDAFAERVPHDTFTLMRQQAPVHWYDWEYGNGFWCITRYDDVVAVLKDWRTFSSETGATALEDLDRDQIEARKSMLDTDPPKHSSLRAIVNKGFTPGRWPRTSSCCATLPARSWTSRCPEASSISSRRSPSSCRSRCCAGFWGCRCPTTSG